MTQASELAVEARWTALLDAYGHFLREAIPRLAPGPLAEHVAEVVQEARIRLARALESHRLVADPAAYVARLAATTTVDAVRRVMSRWAPERGTCPAAETLALAAQAEMDPTVKRELNAHVAECPRCAQERALVEGVVTWSRQVTSIFAATTTAAPAASSIQRPARRVPLAALAALAVVCGVLAIYAAIQRSANRRLLAESQAGARSTSGARPSAASPGAPAPPVAPAVPLGNVALLTLKSQPPTEPAARADVDLAAPALLALTVRADGPREYRLRVRATDGSIAWEGVGFRRTGAGVVTLLLPPRALQPGGYRVDLLDEQARPLHHYFLRVRPSDPERPTG